MDVLFVEARKHIKKIYFDTTFLKKLPKKICLLASLQYIDLLKDARKELEKAGKKVFVPKITCYEGHLIGCKASLLFSLSSNIDAFVILGNGEFHARTVARATSKPVFLVEEKRTKKFFEKKRNFIFLPEETGILISIKPGQQNLKKAMEMKKKLKEKGKKVFLFLADTINIEELENFNIKRFINTACPCLVFDSEKITNIEN